MTIGTAIMPEGPTRPGQRLRNTLSSTGRIVVQRGGKTAQAVLAPIEPNKLVAKLDAPLAKGAVIVVSTTFSDGHAIQARFTVD